MMDGTQCAVQWVFSWSRAEAASSARSHDLRLHEADRMDVAGARFGVHTACSAVRPLDRYGDTA
jgi:hypothetical protein